MTAPIEVAGPATIRTAAAIREQLLAACDGASDVTVDLSGVAEADLSFVQTLHAARRHLAAAGGTLRLAAPAPEPVAALLARAGFLTAPSDDDIQFWFHGELPQ